MTTDTTGHTPATKSDEQKAFDDQARFDLEHQLVSINGLAHVLMSLGALPGGEVEDHELSYLGGQLIDHEEAARDAFCRIFKLNQYREQGSAPIGLHASEALQAEGAKSIAELAEQLGKAIVDHNLADHRSIAAYRTKEDQAPHDAEMLRLEKVQRALIREICASNARTTHEAITQAIVALHSVRLVAEGAGRKRAHEACAGLVSAISGLIDLSDKPIAATVRNRYFDTLAQRSGGAK